VIEIIISILIVLLLITLIFANVKVVPQAHAFVIERLGKYIDK